MIDSQVLGFLELYILLSFNISFISCLTRTLCEDFIVPAKCSSDNEQGSFLHEVMPHKADCTA